MIRRNFILFGAAFTALLAPATVTQAANTKSVVDTAKAKGLVGEQADGLLGFVRPTYDPALQAAVDQINAGRAQLYRETAARNGVSPEAAGAATFIQLVQGGLKPSEFYKPAGGAWTQK